MLYLQVATHVSSIKSRVTFLLLPLGKTTTELDGIFAKKDRKNKMNDEDNKMTEEGKNGLNTASTSK